MRIGELSRRTGVAVHLLRYYEEQGLLHPQRRPSGYREYVEEDVAIVRRIRSLLAAGLGTSTITTVLPCLRDTGDRLVPTCSDLLALGQPLTGAAIATAAGISRQKTLVHVRYLIE
ncbi:MerR family transcriptional regulator, partial [Streptomyces virginiae]